MEDIPGKELQRGKERKGAVQVAEQTGTSKTILSDKLSRLEDSLKKTGGAVILFSGGLDSTLLAFAAFRALGKNTVALTFRSPLMSQQEFEEAVAGAGRIGISHHVIEEPLVEKISRNHGERCYLCRKGRNLKARKWADDNGFNILADGANLSDLGDFRPGMQASEEDGVMHPLLEAGLTKEDVRNLSKQLGLPGWDRESSPCLATRFPYGYQFKNEDLALVEKAEHYLKELGLKEIRVRVYPPGIAVVETSRPDLAWDERGSILDGLNRLGFKAVSLDLEGFTGGKMNRFQDQHSLNFSADKAYQIEATIDDMTGEEIGRSMEGIREKALEANLIPVQGKKGRPAWILHALAAEDSLQDILHLFIERTSTLGVRYWPIERKIMGRSTETRTVFVDGKPHPLRVKISRLGDMVKEKPESDDVGKIEESKYNKGE